MKNESFIRLEEFTEAEKYWLEKLSGQLDEVRIAVHVPEQHQDVDAKYSKYHLVLEGHHLQEHLIAAAPGENDIIFSFRGDKHHQNRIAGEILYHAGLFTPNQIRDLANRYCFILDQVLNHLEIPVYAVKLLSEEEKNRILYEFNQTETTAGIHKTLHRLFEEQVEQTPDHIALVGQIPNPKLLVKGI